MPKGDKAYLRVIDYTGRTFGHLTVLTQAPSREGRTMWFCRCTCGVEKAVWAQSLRAGETQSCGNCLVDRHGLSGTREHRAWCQAKIRCYNIKREKYPRYGGRGITMHPGWRDSFSAFLRDMGPCPDGYTLDRIDNDGPYSPDNCRWASLAEQALNRSNHVVIEVDGESLCVAEWSRRLGISAFTLYARLQRGWVGAQVLGPKQRQGKNLNPKETIND